MCVTTRERAIDLQADEKTDHPFSRVFHGSAFWFSGALA